MPLAKTSARSPKPSSSSTVLTEPCLLADAKTPGPGQCSHCGTCNKNSRSTWKRMTGLERVLWSYTHSIPLVLPYFQSRRDSGVLTGLLSSSAIRTYCIQFTGLSCTTEYADLWDHCCIVLWFIVACTKNLRSVNLIPPNSLSARFMTGLAGVELA